MSQPRTASSRAPVSGAPPASSPLGLEALGGGLAVAAALVVLARWIPLDFRYQPNALGIVSVTTVLGYPTQQEPILFLAFGSLGVLGTWLASGWLGARSFAGAALVAFEGVAFAALAASLWLPTGAATALVAAAWGVLIVLAARAPRAAARADAPASAAAGGARRVAWLALVIAGLAVLRVPRLLQALSVLASDIADAALVRNDWVFQSEDGQHLAWADSLLNGGFHGKDFFCLYGPLYDWSVVWVWKLVGRSLAGWHLHVGLTETLAWVAFLSLAALLLRRRGLLLVLVLLVPHLSLRIGLPFASLAFLLRYGRRGRTEDALGAGVLAGASLLYSQEFGAAAVACAALALCVRPARAALAAYAAGAVAVVAPLALLYARAGALGPMLDDLVGYPAMLVAGFGNLPFPPLRPSLPWPLALDPPDTRLLRTFYAIPAIAVIALGVVLPRLRPDPRHPVRWLRALLADLAASPGRLELAIVALFGLAAFRTALGRSDQMHLYAVAAPSILLVVVGLDRLLDRWRSQPGAVALQLGLGALLLVAGGIATGTGAAGAFHLRNAGDTVARLVRGEPEARGHGAVLRVLDWLAAHSRPEDRLYFLPNDAALYYLTDRRPPTRFVVSHQMVTDAHRDEALADLRAAPPRYVVWNDATLRLDEIGDEIVLGPALWAWLHERYRPVERVGGMRIWEWAGEPDGAAAPAHSR